MSALTAIEGVPDSDDAVPGMAFFAGSGPSGKTCGGCKFRGYKRSGIYPKWNEALQREVYRTYNVQSCAKFKEMTGRHGSPVDKDNRACKYFEPKSL